MHKHVIAICGSSRMGSGTVLTMLGRLGFSTLDADEVAQRLIEQDGAAYQQIVERWGDQFVDSTGGLDRARLYLATSSEPGLMEEIQSILYPLVQQQLIAFSQATDSPLVFIKSSDIGAYGIREVCDQLWLVTGTEAVQVAELVRLQHWPEELAREYVHSHPAPNAEALQADVVLCNNGVHGDLWSQVMQALQALGMERRAAEPQAEHSTAEAATAQESVEAAAPSVGGQAIERQPAQTASMRSTMVLQLRLVGRQLVNSLLILLAIAFLTSWGLLLAEYGRQHLPVSGWQAAWQALTNTGQYLLAHPENYYWAKLQVPWFDLVSTTVGHSAGLLLLSMGLALILALPLGIAAATVRRGVLTSIITVLSVLGASAPSFLLAMMLWVVNIAVHRYLGIKVLPATGFGWDGHLVMPAIVLAMRPLAQVAQVTYITMSDALREDYVRTAHSKGLSWRIIRDRHILPNILIPILNTLGTSLRFSLASLPIVEVFFRWPGVGSMLLDAINQGITPLVIDLILSLGIFFLIVNLLIDFSFPLIDPRLQEETLTENKADSQSFAESLRELWAIFRAWYAGLPRLTLPSLRSGGGSPKPRNKAVSAISESLAQARRTWIRRSLLHNPTLIVSSVVVLLLIGLVLFGASLTSASPYELHGVMSVNGKYAAPPFQPSSVFPWGTDHLGRDIRALVLAGAQKTLSLAFFGMLARLLLGTLFGILSGWGRAGRFDRLISGAMSIWAAFPATLFAMIVIQGLGIQQGMWVFIVAICIVGWGEVAQFVRGQVALLKPALFVESARAAGARTDQILVRHILPNLANPILVLAALEMGGVLMLLAELGFLNVFMGGGFRTMLGETGNMQPVIAYYSDVPEWGALIANVRAQWRAYPWMAVYPGLAVLISILAFNLFGEGLRRFLEESAVSLSRFFNRYTLAAAVSLAVVLVIVLRSSLPLNVYRPEGLKFDEQRVLNDVRILSSPELQGRETGTSGATLAALYIAHRMAEIGIFPAGEHHGYLQSIVQPRLHLQGIPTLSILGTAGSAPKTLLYRQDFSEMTLYNQSRGEAQGKVMGVAYGPTPEGSTKLPDLTYTEAADHVIIVRYADLSKVEWDAVKGVLAVADNSRELQRRYVYPSEPWRSDHGTPCLTISAETADFLLRSTGSSLAALDAQQASLLPGETGFTDEGVAVSLSLPATQAADPSSEKYINVIGVIPGQGHFMGTEEQVIVVSAYYDGLGTDPAGTVYPGANDNASGVAMMLEMARLLKESNYQPDKTVLFVAWAGGERQEGLSVVTILNARAGASDMTVESVMEFSGVGYGTGTSVSIGSDSSYRLVQLFQQAAGRYRIATTTRGRGPHYDLPAKLVFGGRDAMTLSLSWDGSDDRAHTAGDTAELIDPSKLRDVGQPAYLTLLVLSRETEY